MKSRRLRTKRKKMNGGNTVTCRITSDHPPKELQKAEPQPPAASAKKQSYMTAEREAELKRKQQEAAKEYRNESELDKQSADLQEAIISRGKKMNPERDPDSDDWDTSSDDWDTSPDVTEALGLSPGQEYHKREEARERKARATQRLQKWQRKRQTRKKMIDVVTKAADRKKALDAATVAAGLSPVPTLPPGAPPPPPHTAAAPPSRLTLDKLADSISTVHAARAAARAAQRAAAQSAPPPSDKNDCKDLTREECNDTSGLCKYNEEMEKCEDSPPSLPPRTTNPESLKTARRQAQKDSTPNMIASQSKKGGRKRIKRRSTRKGMIRKTARRAYIKRHHRKSRKRTTRRTRRR